MEPHATANRAHTHSNVPHARKGASAPQKTRVHTRAREHTQLCNLPPFFINPRAAMAMTADMVIRNGTLVDGSDDPAFQGDIAIKDGLIIAVGDRTGTGRLPDITGDKEFDASGCLVTPGWVDVHTHYDGQATWDALLSPSCWHGVTTVVMGNCGVGFAPVKPDQKEWLIELMEGVEDIPGTALSDGIRWDWESFPEYLDALERAGVYVPYSCREGTCGTCEVAVAIGIPEHRDSILTERERRANDVMYPCVSRAVTPRLTLDL